MERCCEQEPKSTLASGIDFEMSVDVRNVRHDSLPIWSLGGYHLVHVLLTAQIFHIIDVCVCACWNLQITVAHYLALRRATTEKILFPGNEFPIN